MISRPALACGRRRLTRLLLLGVAGAFLSGGPAVAQGQKTPTEKAPLTLEKSLQMARVGGKYSMLLRQVKVPQDRRKFGAFHELGRSQQEQRGDFIKLPEGYCVYVAPYWYIWRDQTLKTQPARSYGPEQITGPPDTPRPGDYPTAWTPAAIDGGVEWLLVEFPRPVQPRELHIYESFNPGFVTKVSVYRLDGKEVVVWSGKDPATAEEGVSVARIPIKIDFKVNRVKIHCNTRAVSGYNEVDAVKLVAADKKIQWAFAASASSTYGQSSAISSYLVYDPSQATGRPNTQGPGDLYTAWTAAQPDQKKEWLELDYAEAVKPKSVAIYETFNPGAVFKVTVFDPDNQEVEVWKGQDPTKASQSMGISVIPMKAGFKTRRVRIYLNCPSVPGHNEIDAVGLQGVTGAMQWARKARASSSYGAYRGASYGTRPAMEMAKSAMSKDTAVTQRLDRLEKEVRELKSTIVELKALLKQAIENKKK